MSNSISGLTALVCIALSALPTASLAVDGTEHLNVQELPRPGFVPAKPGEGFQLPPVPPVPAAVPAPAGETLQVDSVAFRGNHAIPTVELEAVAASHAGRRLNVADIEELRQKLTRHYVDRGYVNSGALLRPGAFVAGTLTFDIVEGKLGAVNLRGMERLDDSYVAGRLMKDDDVALNVDALRERFQLLLDDPLIARMNARLTPGSRLGEALLDVDVVRARPYQLTLSTNNYRPPSVGANAFSLSGWVRNLTGYGDMLDASIQDSTSLKGEGGRYSVGWRVPVNQRGTQVSFQWDHGQSSVIEQPMQALNIKSTLDSSDVGVSQVFIESLRRKFSMGVNYVNRENRTTLLGQPFSFTPGEPNGVTKVSAWRFWQEYSMRSESQVLALRSTFTWASNNLKDITGLPAGTVQPMKDYRLWLGQAQYVRQLSEGGAQIVVRASIQETSHLLLPLDGISIGGVNTVRGYRENQFVRDTGSVVNIEFDYPILRNPGKGLNVSLVPFYDEGRGRDRDDGRSRTRQGTVAISSVGLATRMRWQGVSLDVALAARLHHPASVTRAGSTLQDEGIHAQLSYQFF